MARLLDKTYTEHPEFIGPVSKYMCYLYEQASNNPLPNELKIPNEAWKPLIQALYKGNNQEEPTYIVDSNLILPYNHEITSDEDKVILAFSGGKDSTANLLYLRDEGKDVTCVFTKGINRSATTEVNHAEEITSMYNVPLLFDQVYIGGKTQYFENPVKNLLIISRLLEYGIKNGCTVVSIGEPHSSVLAEVDIMYDFSDATDFIMLFEKAVQSHVPTFKIDFFFKEESTDMSYLIHKHPEVIPHIQSCLMPTRYKKMQLGYIEKYHLHADPEHPDQEGIMPDRCMNCWKCMAEWLYLVCWNKLPLDNVYLTEKVIPTIKKKLSQLDKTLLDKPNLTNMDYFEALVEIETLQKYVKDPSTIYKDIYHVHSELNRELK